MMKSSWILLFLCICCGNTRRDGKGYGLGGGIGVVDARAILGVDLGSLYMKVALVQSGSPLEIVTNLHSKRKTEQLILFDNDSRYYGADAAALLARKSHITPSAMSVMLGRDEQHPTVRVLAERHYPIRPEYNESRAGVTLRVDGHEFTPEELVAMVLSHAVDISVAYALESGGTQMVSPPRDVVLTVPSFSTQRERQALLDAAELADLKVLTLIDETTAAALHYAMDKSFDTPEKEQILLFYNMGGSSLQVSLVRFFNYDHPQKYGKPKSTPCLEVLAKAWDMTFGGEAIDHILVEMMANQFNEKYRKEMNKPDADVRTNSRAMMKIRLQANKVKHVLSANQEIPVHLDSVLDDVSITLTISRTQLEEAMKASGMLQRAVAPVLQVLQIANKTVDDLNGTELLGGGMRVPCIQNELQKVLPNKELGLHINADESFALGAAFAGANISTAFRVRQVGMIDLNPYPIQVTLSDNADTKDKKGSADDEIWSKQAVIFKSFGKIGIKKTIAFTHDKDVECALDYAIEDDKLKLLPDGTDPALERYQIKGIAAFTKEMTDKKLLNATNPKPKVSLQFELSSSGIASLVKAEVAVEETYTVQETIEVDDDSDSEDSTNTTTEEETKKEDVVDVQDDSNTTNTTETTNTTTKDEKSTTKKKKKTKIIEKEKKRLHKRSLDVQTYYVSRVRPHSPELFTASKAKLLAMAERDKERMLLQEAKNKVESYIYKIKNKLMDDEEAVAAVSTEEQREEVSKLAQDAEEWLYEDGYDADLKTMEAKYLEISVPFEKILLRMSEIKARPLALAALEKKLGEIEALMTLWNETKPHITAEEKDLVLKQVEEIRKSVEEKEEEQKLKKAHEEPVFVSSEIPDKTMLLEKLILALDKKPKPKPPKETKKKKKVEANETETNETSSSSANATADGQEGSGGDKAAGNEEKKDEKDEANTASSTSESSAEDTSSKEDSAGSESSASVEEEL